MIQEIRVRLAKIQMRETADQHIAHLIQDRDSLVDYIGGLHCSIPPEFFVKTNHLWNRLFEETRKEIES